MDRIMRMKNPIQEYAWGSHTAIAELLGEQAPSELPQAELWMGAHPKAPSKIAANGGWERLDTVIDRNPIEILGAETAKKFAGRLPYLFKVLAAAEPLSIQAHPTRDQARSGYDRENRAGIPLDAPHRNYRDDNHKPEIICALSPFWALNGFRDPRMIASLLDRLNVADLAPEREELQSPSRLKGFFEDLMSLDATRKERIIRQVCASAQRMRHAEPVFRWVAVLCDAYPGDIGLLSPVLLNLIRLEPGQAMFLNAGQLHAYLEGTGIELMANSDNVLRGGLTPKHVDVPELLRVLDFDAHTPEVLTARPVSGTESVYPSSAEEFVLSTVAVGPGRIHSAGRPKSAEILLCAEGEVTIAGTPDETSVVVQKGTSILIPAAAGPYIVKGQGMLYKAAVPV